MNPTIKESWCNALESGEYHQGIGKLKNQQNEFCCLGVLSNLASENHLCEWVVSDLSPDFYSCYSSETKEYKTDDYLLKEVISWAELEQHTNNAGDVLVRWSPILEKYGYSNGDYNKIFISELNDAEVPFSVIAQLIRDQF
jgi:hypothetical protein